MADKVKNLRRLEAQRNELNAKVGHVGGGFRERSADPVLRQVRMLREELVLLHEPPSHVAEVVKSMGKTLVNVKVGRGPCLGT